MAGRVGARVAVFRSAACTQSGGAPCTTEGLCHGRAGRRPHPPPPHQHARPMVFKPRTSSSCRPLKISRSTTRWSLTSLYSLNFSLTTPRMSRTDTISSSFIAFWMKGTQRQTWGRGGERQGGGARGLWVETPSLLLALRCASTATAPPPPIARHPQRPRQAPTCHFKAANVLCEPTS